MTRLEMVEKYTVIIGSIIAVISLIVTAYQMRSTAKISRAQFWLELREMFAKHNDIHVKLRPGGEWHKSKTSPSEGEMPKVEEYLGLFEHCKEMLDEKLIDWNTFKNIYAYRIDNILANPIIVREKLNKQKDGWKIFLELVEKLGRRVPADRA